MSLLLQVSCLESLCCSLRRAAEAGLFVINRNCTMIFTSSADLFPLEIGRRKTRNNYLILITSKSLSSPSS